MVFLFGWLCFFLKYQAKLEFSCHICDLDLHGCIEGTKSSGSRGCCETDESEWKAEMFACKKNCQIHRGVSALDFAGESG